MPRQEPDPNRMYRSPQPTSILDLLLGAANGSAPGGSPDQPAQSYSGSLSPGAEETIRALEQQAFGPDQPAPKQKEIGFGKRLGLSLAQALGTYGSVLAHQGPVDYISPEQRKLDEQNALELRSILDQSQRGRQSAIYKLNKIESEKDRTIKAQENAAAKAETKAWNEKKLAAETEQARLDREAAAAAKAAELKSRMDIERMGNEARLRSDAMQVELHKLKQIGEDDKDQHKEYATMRKDIVAARRQYEQALASGQVTPEQVIQDWQDTLDASDLAGKYREAADAFFQDKMVPLLMRYAPTQGPTQGPNPGRGLPSIPLVRHGH